MCGGSLGTTVVRDELSMIGGHYAADLYSSNWLVGGAYTFQPSDDVALEAKCFPTSQPTMEPSWGMADDDARRRARIAATASGTVPTSTDGRREMLPRWDGRRLHTTVAEKRTTVSCNRSV